MRIVFAGTPSVALPTLAALIEQHQVVGVVTKPDARVGRGRRTRPCAVAEYALERELPLWRPGRIIEARTELLQAAPDLGVIVAYGGLVPQSVLDIPKHGWINLHFSRLPKWRGAAPVQRALWAGDTTLGISVFRLVKELDAGPIYCQEDTEVSTEDTAGEVLARLAEAGVETVLEAIEMIARGVEPVPQTETGVTLAPSISADELPIDWTQPAEMICNQVRALSPEPAAWTSYCGKRVKVLRAADPLVGEGEPGVLLPAKKSLRVMCGDGLSLELVELQPAGKAKMPGSAWANGLPKDDPGGFHVG